MRAPAEARAHTNSASGRRVAALVLPALLSELAEPRPSSARAAARRLPLAVVLEAGEGAGACAAAEISATSVLSAVNDVARRLGVREGQSVAEARVLASRLVVRKVAQSALGQGLARVAEIALGFGTVVAFSAPDTVWVDVTGVSHLFGGETALAAELAGQVRESGHRVRVALSDGPALAQAFARFGDLGSEGVCVVPSAQTRESLARLPVHALSLPNGLENWFVRLGVLQVADLLALPRAALGERLSEHATRVLDLIAGHDPTPLVRYEPPRQMSEEASWEEPVNGQEPLLFVLRGLMARISARLRGRGEAARELVVRILADPVLARFRNVPRETTLEFSLPKALYREEELLRIVGSRLERVTLGAPSVGLRIEVSALTESMPRQLELGALLTGAKAGVLDELPIVLAELCADLGENRVGILRTVDSHRPELTSELIPALGQRSDKPRVRKARQPLTVSTLTPAGAPPFNQRLTRLLPEPVLFEAPLRTGASVALERRLYTIDSVRFAQRLEAVEWWSRAVHRDYVRVVLRGSDGMFEVLVYVDRESGQRYLQGIFD